jgi:hypothetical protein
MKRLISMCLMLVVLLAARESFAQVVTGQIRTITLTSANSQAPPYLDFTASGLAGQTSHKFSWITNGTVSAGACRMEKSANAASWSEHVAAQTVTSSGGPTAAATGSFKYGRIYCTTPIAGSGSVTFVWIAEYETSQGGSSGGDVSIPDGDDEALGAIADASVSAGATGTISAKLRRISADIDSLKTLVTAAGNVAHDGVDAGNPIKIGGKAISLGSNPTEVGANDRTDFYANRAGVPFVLGGHPNTITRTCRAADADGAQTNVACVAVSAGTKIVVTAVMANCDGSNSGPINIKVGFGTATLPADATTGASGILATFDGVPAGLGFSRGNGGGILGIGGDDEDVRYTMEDPVGGACSVSVSYFTIAG